MAHCLTHANLSARLRPKTTSRQLRFSLSVILLRLLPPLIYLLLFYHGCARAMPMSAPCLEVGHRMQQAIEEIEGRYGRDVIYRSHASLPSPRQLSLLLSRLLSGLPLTVVVVGGSISAAARLPGGMQHGNHTYGQVLVDWMNEVFPTTSGRPHRLLRAFLPGAGSPPLDFCAADLFLSLWPDGRQQWGEVKAREAHIVLLDCAANDWALLQPGMDPPPAGREYAAAEGLLRRFLLLPSSPLVLFLHFGVFEFGHPSSTPFLSSAERMLSVLSSYYSVPAVSMWRAFFPVLATSELRRDTASASVNGGCALEGAEELSFRSLFVDHVHPSIAGHRMAGSLVAHFLLSLSLQSLHNEAHHAPHPFSPSHPWLSPSMPAASDCPPSSLCAKCLLDPRSQALVLSSLHSLRNPLPECGLPPLQVSLDRRPFCVPVGIWTAVHPLPNEAGFLEGARGSIEGVTAITQATEEEWERVHCGPLVPQLLCWKALRPGAQMTVELRARKNEWIKAVGVIYKMMNFTDPKYTTAGADMTVNGDPAGFLEVPVKGNRLTQWYLKHDLFDMPRGHPERVIVTLVTRTDFFHVLAVVGLFE